MDQGRLFFLTTTSIRPHFFTKVWGEAYSHSNDTMSTYARQIYLPSGQEILLGHPYPLPTSAHVHSLLRAVGSSHSKWPAAEEHPYYYVGIFAAISLSVALVNVVGAVLQYTGALRASRKLFEKLLVGVVRATMRWHDVTPQGELKSTRHLEHITQHVV